MEKHKKDQTFTFSVRQQANKGAEDDYFIGTENSNYFATTFWYIPVAYPGNASELISVVFKLLDHGYSYSFRLLQTKSPHNDQNKSGLELVTKLRPLIEKTFSNFYGGKSEGKMESYRFDSSKPLYQSISELLEDLDVQLQIFIPIVNNKIEDIQSKNNEFTAHRYSQKEFDVMLQNLTSRRTVNKLLKENRIPSNNEKETSQEEKEDKKQQPLNQILYGPPGTGKTYNSINKAIEIINNKFYIQNENNRTAQNKFFKESLISDWDGASGQIAFITFHQNMSYEDFIEGIKPIKPKENETLRYDIEDGIFKKICKKATSNYESSLKKNKGKLPFEEAFERLKEEWENDSSIMFPLKTKGYDFTIIGFTNTSIQFEKANGGTSHTLSINTLKDQYYGKEYNFKQGVGIYYPGVLSRLYSYQKEEGTQAELLNYVLIIDEINRGNVSQIFGELITLIEQDKRLGKQEELEIILPYSKENFSVPPNLYIVGTMNTADRSVEALDTALRRRFTFHEKMPQPEILHPKKIICRFWNDPKYNTLGWQDEPFLSESNALYSLLGIDRDFENDLAGLDEGDAIDWTEEDFDLINDVEFKGIRLDILLETINKRIERLLSRDNCIGHSYFLKVRSVKDLIECFKNEIIPLLQEYFYGDYGKMCLVLGKGFVDIDPDKSSGDEKYFANADHDLIDSFLEKKVWKIDLIETEDEFLNAIDLLLNQ
jgi:hypothetical protein